MSFSFKMALRYFWGRKSRAVLTTLAIVLGVMLTFGMSGMIPTIERAFRDNMLAIVDAVDLTIKHETNGSFDAETMQQLQTLDGLAAMSGVLEKAMALPADLAPQSLDQTTITSFNISGVNPATIGMVDPLDVGSGRTLHEDDGAVLVIADPIARHTGLTVGDHITLPTTYGTDDFKIIGILKDSPTVNASQVFMPLTQAQVVFNQPGKINTIKVMLLPGMDLSAASQQASTLLGDAFAINEVQTGTEYMAMLEVGRYIPSMFGVIALITGGFIIFITFRTVIAERQHDIGLLRAVGASRRNILALILTESIIQGLIGTALGLLAGFFMVQGMVAAMRPMWQQMLSMPLGDPVYSPGAIILCIVMGMGITVLGAIFPAISASRVTPIEAIRTADLEVQYPARRKTRLVIGLVVMVLSLATFLTGAFSLISLGMILFLIGLILAGQTILLPVARLLGWLLRKIYPREGYLAHGNLIRQPARTATTAMAMTFSFAVVLGMMMLVTSLIFGVSTYLDKTMGSDFLIVPQTMLLSTGNNVGASETLINEVRAMPQIDEVTTMRSSGTQIDDVDVQVIGINPPVFSKVVGLEFISGDEAQAYQKLASGRNVMLNGVYASQCGKSVGDEIALLTFNGVQVYQVVGIANDFMNAKINTVYLSYENMQTDFNITTDMLYFINQKADADAAATQTELENLVEKYPAFTVFSAMGWRTLWQQQLLAATGVLYMLLLVLVVPSLLALANTLGISVIERTREIGVLRAVGATQKQVKRMIVGESLLLSGIGLVFGIGAGLWMGYVLVQGMASIGMAFPLFFPWAGIILMVFIALVIGYLAAIVPTRYAARMNIVNALKYE